MLRATVSTSFARIFVSSIIATIPIPATAGPAIPPLIVSGQGLISPKQPVPDDPLAGLPTEDGGNRERGKKGSPGGNTACALKASAANERDVGDLRATLAFVKHGPQSWPCPSRADRGDVHLRISIDSAGKVTAVDPAAGNASVTAAIAKRVLGKSVSPRPEGSTIGIVVLTFTPGKQH
ncbi:MAG TPA: hypothetical protein VIM14_11535 [Polyangia bacterium]